MPAKRKRPNRVTKQPTHKIQPSGGVMVAVVELGFYSRMTGDFTKLRRAVDRLANVFDRSIYAGLVQRISDLEHDSGVRRDVYKTWLTERSKIDLQGFVHLHKPSEADLNVFFKLMDEAMKGMGWLASVFELGVALGTWAYGGAAKGQLGCQARDLKELIGNTPKQVRSSVPILEQVFRTPISEKARVGGLLAKVFEQTGISQPRENMRLGKRVCRFFAIVCDQLYKVDPTGLPTLKVFGIAPPDHWMGLAYFMQFILRKNQTEIAEELLKQGIQREQGTISRGIKRVEKWLALGNTLAEILPTKQTAPREIVMDPRVLDWGERQDGRTRRQRYKREDEDDENN